MVLLLTGQSRCESITAVLAAVSLVQSKSRCSSPGEAPQGAPETEVHSFGASFGFCCWSVSCGRYCNLQCPQCATVELVAHWAQSQAAAKALHTELTTDNFSHLRHDGWGFRQG